MKPFKQALEEVIQEHDEITHERLLTIIEHHEERINDLEKQVENLETEIMLINQDRRHW